MSPPPHAETKGDIFRLQDPDVPFGRGQSLQLRPTYLNKTKIFKDHQINSYDMFTFIVQ